MKVAIIGGGFTGLTAGFFLSQKNKVVIFEKKPFLGGLAAGFKKRGWDWSTEFFFHHFFASDQKAKELITKLGLKDKLFYKEVKTSIFKNGKISQFDSPLSLLRFPHLSLGEKSRTGLVLGYLKFLNNWSCFEKTTANNWLEKKMGRRVFEILWRPLLKGKFAKFAKKISMAWFWARIKKRSKRLGYLKGGFQVLVEKLKKEIEKNGGEIKTKTGVEKISIHDTGYRIHDIGFDKVIFTAPTPVFLKVTHDLLPKDYQKRLSQFKFLGALNLILVLKEKFLTDNTYWLNINESDFPFVALVEHTNFVDPKYYGDNHILYVGGYYPSDHPYFKMGKEEIFKEFLPYLKKINPSFDFSLLTTHYSLLTTHYAQPVMPINYSKIMPKIKTPIKNLYLANQSLIYPWDRGVNYAIELGEKVAEVAQK